jgi:sigma-E factor negative regulatory protein RseC
MIEHEGIVEEISDNNLTVRIFCNNLHAEHACAKRLLFCSRIKRKAYPYNRSTEKIQVYDKVIVLGTESMGYKAVFWAYIAPLILILFTVILATTVWKTHSKYRAHSLPFYSLIPIIFVCTC